MMIALWVLLPYGAILSCVIGHLWRYRRDGFRGHLYGPHIDRAERFGIHAFRIGVPILFVARVTEVFAAGPDSRPEGGIRILIIVLQVVAIPLAMTGAALILVPPLIAADARRRVSAVDRLTLPVLVATVLSAMLVTFDATPGDGRYRSAETLFTWSRSVLTLHPQPAVMAHAPALYQARGLIVMLLIAIWPYTRLAGIFSIPAIRMLRQTSRLAVLAVAR
ncbi:respiratory nitrate reductase subunit gamma [Nocardia yamanashiensis]|uniref:respiratory nitrate reductase subunit gamma n=1 Tax=Nocardia yamanashiensis TaxID=209247 RepID=UPI001E47CA3F|nr:respiratory nitrate reductase subunit gamma [Nocardia yamanashiensis]UGT44998.1 respiratory nitrate reductase subunit gamma [Nocardia yamanashiensis]